MKKNLILPALAASTISLLAATPAVAQNYTIATAIAPGGAPTGAWSAVRIGGPSGTPCNTGAPVLLTAPYVNGTIAGRDGLLSPDQPIVAKNFAGPFASGGITLPAGGVLQHPGPNGECSVLRLTIPAGQGGVYRIVARYQSVDSNAASAGDGVNAMVLHNGVQIGNVVDTSQGAGQILQQRTLCPGDKVDFAVHMKGGMSFDSTQLSGEVNKVGDTQQCGGPIITVPADPTVGASPCCAPWSELNIGPALVPTFTNASSPYTIQYQADPTIGAQMAAYLNYIHAMNPNITTISVTWQAVDVGSTPGMSGTANGGPQTLTWTWNSNGTVTQPTGNFWGSQQFQVGHWYRYWTKTSFGGPNGPVSSPYLGPDCIHNSKAFMWGMSARMAGGGDGGIATLSTTNARGQVVTGRPVEIIAGRPLNQAAVPSGAALDCCGIRPIRD